MELQDKSYSACIVIPQLQSPTAMFCLQVAGFTSTDDGFHEYHRVTRVSNLLPDHTSTYLDFFQLADARCQQDKYQPSGVVYALAQIQGDHRLEEQVVTLHKDSIANYTTVEQCRELLAKSGFRQPGLEVFAQQVSCLAAHSS